MYTEHRPCTLLSPYIDKYWEFEGNPEQGTRINILPDGCTDFIFTLGDSPQTLNGNLTMRPFHTYFIGPMTGYSELITYTKTVHMLGIRFRPYGIFRFLELPLHELTDQRLYAGDINTFFNDSWTQQLSEQQITIKQISLIETRLIQALYEYKPVPDKPISYAINQINTFKGKLSIHTLVDNICLSQRHFERKFKTYTGYTPKAYSRIVKFRNAVDILRKTTFDNLLSIAIETGYYDVPHLSREIKKMSGNTPLSFLSLPPESETALLYIEQ